MLLMSDIGWEERFNVKTATATTTNLIKCQ